MSVNQVGVNKASRIVFGVVVSKLPCSFLVDEASIGQSSFTLLLENILIVQVRYFCSVPHLNLASRTQHMNMVSFDIN